MLIDDDDGLRRVLETNRSLAVVGMKPPGGGPAWSVPAYMRRNGYTTVGVNPKYEDIGGIASVPGVDALADPVDMIVVFRRPEYVDGLADEILAMDDPPNVVWLQLGIRNDDAAERLADAGIDVVQDRCLYIEHPRLMR